MAFRRFRAGKQVSGDSESGGREARARRWDEAAGEDPPGRPERDAEDRPPELSKRGTRGARKEEAEVKRGGGESPKTLVMNAALKILAARARSESELRARLLRKPYANEALVDQCVAKLKELGYVNDSQFARGYARSRVSTKAVGRSRLARELAGKRVEKEAIHRALDDVYEETGEDELIDRALAKRLRTHGRPEDQAASKRLFDHLARLGFGYDLIIRKLRDLKSDLDS